MPGPARPFVLLVAAQQDEYGSRIWSGARSVLEPAGLSLVVHFQGRPDVPTPPTLRRILRFGVPRGVILTPLVDADAEAAVMDLVTSLQVPAAAVAYAGFPGAGVMGDSETAMRALMRHLIEECGVRRPVLLRGKPGQVDAVERERIFREELGHHGIAVDEEFVLEGMFWHDTSYHALRRLLQRRRDLDAVVAANDLSAFGALQALREEGLDVPRDVRLTGFDDLELARATLPNLTTVAQDVVEQGRVAARLLLEVLDGGTRRRTVVVPAKLVVRGSTRPDAPSVEALTSMAFKAEGQLAELGAISSLSRALAHGRTLEEMLSALAACLSWLGVDRFFVAVHRPDPAATDAEDDGPDDECGAEDLEQVSSLVVFDYRQGRVQLPPAEAFPAHRILPDALRAELGAGLLAMQPLEMAGREIGYMLFDRTRGTITTSEIFQINISRTVDAILSALSLADHAANLEDLVTRRTHELEAEVRTRRVAEQQLQRANVELQRQAMVDGLTGLANRAAFEQHLHRYWELGVREGRGLSVVLVDVDCFKAFNDHYGHLGGDHALRVVASCLQRAITGQDDLAGRYGGEEFIAVLPDGDLAAATAVAQRFRRLLTQAAIPHAASPVSPIVTASIGIAARDAGGGTAVGLVGAADEALYRAKAAGRDRVCSSDRPRPDPTGAGQQVPAPRRTPADR